MTDTYAVGDKVTMRAGAKSLYDMELGGLTGEVKNADTTYASRTHTLEVKFPRDGTARLVRPEDVVPAKTGGYTDAQIDAALKTVKANGGYCREFDVAVQEAREMPLLDRLKYVADDNDRVHIYVELLDALKAAETPPYVMPKVPEVGDYVRLTMKNGKIKEGEVKNLRRWTDISFEPIEVSLPDGDYGYCYQKDPGNYNPMWQIIKVEQLPKPVKIPQIGKWVEAVTKDGKTHTFKVTANKYSTDSTGATFLRAEVKNGNDFFVAPDRGYYRDETRWIKSWEYVAEPVEIDGYYIIWSNREDTYRAYRLVNLDSAKRDSGAWCSADDHEDAMSKIARYAATPDMQAYIPALVAITKFIALEETKEAK